MMVCSTWAEIALAIGSVLGGLSAMIISLGIGMAVWREYGSKK